MRWQTSISWKSTLGAPRRAPRPSTAAQCIFWYNRTHNLLSNLTTNEWHNRKRYPHFKSIDGSFINPFDQGVPANCQMFFCPAAQSLSSADGLLAAEEPGAQAGA